MSRMFEQVKPDGVVYTPEIIERNRKVADAEALTETDPAEAARRFMELFDEVVSERRLMTMARGMLSRAQNILGPDHPEIKRGEIALNDPNRYKKA